ncbi:MAG: iron-containing alcohol dehydrogenase [Chloroflexota bacterium]|nr:MAG: iron-containing alcohol dehydrogenase [Chloroflexota bacterium]
MTGFEFATSARIVFGAGSLNAVGPAAAAMGKRALIASGSCAENCQALIEQLAGHGLESVQFSVDGEPTVASVSQAAELARRQGCDLVIGIGGGSSLDTAKAVSILVHNRGNLLDYLEVIGAGKPFTEPAVPCIAIPTTAGTGSEVTRNAVVGSPEHRVKVSMRSPSMLPRLALVDPELTYSLPPDVTASTGLDALTQLIEPFVSVRANPMTDSFCREGIPRAARSLERAYRQGRDAGARADMSLASLFGGLALANAALGAVHGFAGVLGGMFPGPHGAICARLLPFVMDANIRYLEEHDPQGETLRRYAEVARMLTGQASASLAHGIEWVSELCAALNVPPLSAYGVTPEDIPDVVEKSSRASSMKGNPVRLPDETLAAILASAI